MSPMDESVCIEGVHYKEEAGLSDVLLEETHLLAEKAHSRAGD